MMKIMKTKKKFKMEIFALFFNNHIRKLYIRDEYNNILENLKSFFGLVININMNLSKFIMIFLKIRFCIISLRFNNMLFFVVNIYLYKFLI